jgi:hypothetical protein
MKNTDLKAITNLLIGLSCWSIIGGKGTGSVIHLGFGSKKLRDRPLKNPHLTEEERLYDPDISLMVYCSWRLSSETDILCSWREAISNIDNMLLNLELIRNKKIIKIDICPLSLDLDIYFEGNNKLEIFCDETNDYDADNNYSLFTEEKIINAGLKSVLYCETK